MCGCAAWVMFKVMFRVMVGVMVRVMVWLMIMVMLERKGKMVCGFCI